MYPEIETSIDICITVIAFQRAECLHVVLKALKNNRDIDRVPLRIYIDGAHQDKHEEQQAVEDTKKVAEDFQWNGDKRVIASAHNRGLQQAVRFGLDTSLQEFESTIVVEDDIVTSPFFFRFMLQGLSKFSDDKRIAAICGHVYQFDRERYNPQSPFALGHFACWGWATWRDRWQQVRWDAKELYVDLRKSGRLKEFNFGIGDYVSRVLEDQARGVLNTWDVQTGASFFLQNQVCVYPPETLTNNIGWRQDGKSTHMQHNQNPNAALAYSDFQISEDFDPVVQEETLKAYSRVMYPNPLKQIIKKIILTIFPFLKYIRR